MEKLEEFREKYGRDFEGRYRVLKTVYGLNHYSRPRLDYNPAEKILERVYEFSKCSSLSNLTPDHLKEAGHTIHVPHFFLNYRAHRRDALSDNEIEVRDKVCESLMRTPFVSWANHTQYDFFQIQFSGKLPIQLLDSNYTFSKHLFEAYLTHEELWGEIIRLQDEMDSKIQELNKNGAFILGDGIRGVHY